MRKLQSLSALAAVTAALALWCSPAFAAVSVGHSGWAWSNPLPQGNAIRTLDLIGNDGYAAGDFGTLLRTADGGTTWTGIATGITESIVRVQMIDPDSLVIAGGCAVRRSDDGGERLTRLPWAEQESPCRAPIASLVFPSSDIGYLLLEDGRVYRSGDGGQTWQRMTSVPGTSDAGGSSAAKDIVFTEGDAGLAATVDGIYRSADGGVTWSAVASRTGGFNGLSFDGATGYAVGSDSSVFKSTDGGLSWVSRPVDGGQPLTLTSISCASTTTCLVTIDAGGRLLRTSDGGNSWGFVSVAATMFAAAFASPTRVVAAGALGQTAVSTDGGESWPVATSAATLRGQFTRLCGRSGSFALAIGEKGALARTTDGGETWVNLPVPTSEELLDVSFSDRERGFVIGAEGSLLRTDDGGETWTEIASGTPAPQAVLALDRDRVLVVGVRGVRRSRNGGDTFRSVRRRAVRTALLFDVDRAGSSLFAYGPTSLLRSRDGGKRWKKLNRPDNRPLAAVDFGDASTGFALTKGGRIWRTRNRGRSWKEILSTGTDGGMELAFSGPGQGYIASNDLFSAQGNDRPDYLLRTTDSGRSWRPQLVSPSQSFTGLIATPDSTGLLLADGNQFFTTSSGGDRGERSRLGLRAGRRTLRGPGRVRLSGRLSPADGGEQVIVSSTAVDPHHRQDVDWVYKTARVHSDGSFTTSWKLRRTSAFVAQWTGDADHAGDGSTALKVRVRGRSK